MGVAAGSGVGLCNQSGEAEGGLTVYAQSILEMRSFAYGLFRTFPSVLKMVRKRRMKQPKLA
jgi:hypothetical protein